MAVTKTAPKKTKKKSSPISFKLLFLSCLVAVLGLSLGLATIVIFLSTRIYPGISIGNIDLSYLSKPESQIKLESDLSRRLNQNLELNYQESTTSAPQKFTIGLSTESVDLNLNDALNQAFEYGHTKLYPLNQLLNQQKISLSLQVTPKPSLESQIKIIAQQIDQPPIDASLKIDSGQITVSQSQDGKGLDHEQLQNLITAFIKTGEIKTSILPVKTLPPKLSYDSALEIKNRLDQIKLSPLKLVFKDQTFTLDLDKILSLIDLQNSQNSLVSGNFMDNHINISSAQIQGQEVTDSKLTLNEVKVKQYLNELSSQINRDVQEPLFSIDPSSDPKKPKIKEFKPPEEGQALLTNQAYQKLTEALLNPDQSIVNLPVKITSPKNKLVNDLGIKELIGRGISNFSGSIQNRIYNIGLASSRINGILISPGETFSFANTVGDITAATGYKQAYVIKSGRTVLDDGGGVCQVSTTLFRAVLYSGLPVVARTAHAYRVGYYEQGYPPGLDATIFYPSVDFQFKNDTPASVLIQAYIDGYNLYVDFYGTSDNRQASISKPVIANQTPPPPELRQDDPTLPKGTVKQVDFPAWGANVTFNRTVLRSGQTIINETFKSNYRPWQAIFLVGTKEG